MIVPLCYRVLHPSQQILSDTQLQRFPCVLNDDFALATEDREINTVLSNRCPYNGLVRNVFYGILAEQGGQQKHIGDLHSLAEAQSAVRHLSFGGGYNRCWRIRKTYLPITTWDSLCKKLSTKMSIRLSSVLIPLFWCNEHGVVGFHLHNTPWTGECLGILEMTVAVLRQEQLTFGLDEHLVGLLHFAG